MYKSIISKFSTISPFILYLAIAAAAAIYSNWLYNVGYSAADSACNLERIEAKNKVDALSERISEYDAKIGELEQSKEVQAKERLNANVKRAKALPVTPDWSVDERRLYKDAICAGFIGHPGCVQP